MKKFLILLTLILFQCFFINVAQATNMTWQDYNNLGNYQHSLGNYRKAIEDYNYAIEINPYESSIYTNRGTTKYALGDYIGAIADFKYAIHLNPQDSTAKTYLPIAEDKAHEAQSRYEKNLIEYGKAVNTNIQSPKNIQNSSKIATPQNINNNQFVVQNVVNPKTLSWQDYYNNGVQEFNQNNYNAAIADFTNSIKLYPNLNSYVYRGIAYSKLQNYDSSIQDFTNAINLSPKYSPLYKARGRIKEKKNDYYGAIDDYKKAIELDPNSDASEYIKIAQQALQKQQNSNIETQENTEPSKSSTSTNNNNNSWWKIILFILGIYWFIQHLNEEAEKKQRIEKCNRRERLEDNKRNNIEINVPKITIQCDSNGKPRRPSLQKFLDEETYKFADRYEKMSIDEKMEIILPADYFENKGIYYRYYSYNLAMKLYNEKLESYNSKQERILKQQKSYWRKYWSEKQQDGFDFENAVADLYRKLCYKVTVTKGTGDGGVDLILKKDGQITIVQCKAHKHQVGPEPVRALWGVREDFGANSAIFVAYSGVTQGAWDFVRGKKLRIVDADELINMSLQVYSKKV